MVSRLGRPQFWAVAYSSALACLAIAAPETARAQQQDRDVEVIQDPELQGTPLEGGSAGADQVIQDPELQGTPLEGGGAGDQVIHDPELEGAPPAESSEGFEGDYGWGEVYQPPDMDEEGGRGDEDEYDPMANTGLASLEVALQSAFDLRHEGKSDPALGLEDVYETRLRIGGEIEFRRSRHLRLVVGSRIDMLWAVPSQNDAYVEAQGQRALDQDRFEVDIIPTAAYIDWTAFPGGHLRIGHQVLSLGRMDFVSNTDALAVYDLRPQPTLNPAAVHLAQPAVRFDWDITTKVTLKLAYVPWFMPHLMRPDRDKYKATVLAGAGTAALPEDLDGIIDPSFQTQSAEANIRFVGPAPDFTTPQAQAWLGFRTRLAQFRLTGATALEKVPSYYLTDRLDEFLRCDPYLPANMPTDTDDLGECGDLQTQVGGLAFNGLPVFDAQFHRYFLVGADTTFNAGPVSFALEGAFSPERHLYAATRDGSRLPQPNVTQPISRYPPNRIQLEPGCVNPGTDPEACLETSNLLDRGIRKGVPVVQGGFHAEYLRGESLILVGEFFWTQALKLPHDRTRQWLGFQRGIAAAYGGAIAASYLSGDGLFRLDMSVLTLNGPSLALVPNVEFRVKQGLYLNAGAQIIEGPNPGINGSVAMNFGGLFGGQDQVFVGLRWLP